MADRYWVAGGTGNYNSTTNWSATSGGASGASVPSTADNVFFNALSGMGTATINVASNCANLNITGFIGTIVFNANLAINGTVFNLGIGGYTISTPSIFGLALNSSMTITSNATTWTGRISVGNVTITLADNLTVSGTWAYTSTGTSTVNGNTLFISGNLTHSSTAIATGTTAFRFNGTGTWSHTSTGVLRNNVTINTAGTLTIGTNVYYNTGTLTRTAGTVVTTGSTLNIGASTTLNTNGLSWNNISITATSTITLGSNLTLTGTLNVGTSITLSFTLSGFSLVTSSANLTLSSPSTFNVPQNLTFINVTALGGAIINGNQISITGNYTSFSGSGTVSGTTTLVMTGTGTVQGNIGQANNLIFNTAGTITISSLVYITGTITYTAGTIITTGSTLTITSPGPVTLNTNGITWNNITFSGGSFTTTLTSNLSLTGLLFLSGVALTINGSTLNIGGGISTNATTTLGTTLFNYNGTGTWITGTVATIRNNFTVNTAGTLTIGTTVYYNTGTFTYITGTVVTTGSTLIISVPPTLNTNGIIWNNITTSFTGAITLTSNLTLTGALTVSGGTLSFVLGGNSLISTNANLTMGTSGTLTMPANQTFKRLSTTGSGVINTNTLTITENLTIGASAPISGTTAIIYGGTGTWTAGNSASLINNIFTINTAGTLTISGIVYKAGTFTYTAGTIIDTTGTVAAQVGTLNLSGFTFRKLLVNGAITLSSNINATTFGTWGTSLTNFTLGAFSLNFTHLELGNSSITTLPTAWVCQNIEFTNVSAGTLNSNSITINGNILQSGGSVYSGTTTFTYAGTGTWTAPSINSYFSNSFTINTVGTLTFISANLGGGIFTYTAGTVVTTGSTLNIVLSNTTMNDGTIVWYNVFLRTNVTTFTLNNQLVCSNALTVDNSQVIFAGTDGTFDVYYLNLNSSGTVARNPKLVSTKTYRVRAGFTSQGTLAFPITLSSTIAASQAIFTVDPGATIDVGFVNATDINSSLGRPIYSYRGVFSNTLNWSLLPVDPVIGGGETSYVYVG